MKRLFLAIVLLSTTSCTALPSFALPSQTLPSLSKTALTATPDFFLHPSNTPTLFSEPIQVPPPSATPTFMAWTAVPTPTLRANTPLAAGQGVQITSSRMIDAQNGWGFDANGHILRTLEGGTAWRDATPPTGNYMPSGFFALNDETAWATPLVYGPGSMATTAYVWRTMDGGRLWTPSQIFRLNLDSFGNPYPYEFFVPIALQFMDAQTGWLLADVASGMNSARPLFFQTTDSGETWTTINDRFGFPGPCVEVGFAFVNAQTGWAGGNCFSQGVVSNKIKFFLSPDGWIVSKTIDGGHAYDQQTVMPLPDEFQGPDLLEKEGNCGEVRILSIAADVIGIEWGCSIFTHLRPDYTYFALSADGGQTWKSWKSSGNESFLDAIHGWRLLSPSQLQQTTDGGLNWTTIKTVAWENAQFDFVTDKIGWAIVTHKNQTAFVQTMDGGATWIEIKPLVAP